MDIITVPVLDGPLPTAPHHPQDPTGPLWVEVRPDLRRLHVLAGDVLAALGKRRDIAGKGRNEYEDSVHAQAWLAAHRTRELVVLHAERLRPQTLGRLCDLAAGAGLQHLWLLHGPPPTEAHAHGLARRTTRIGDVDDVAPARTARTPNLLPACDLPRMPRVEFTSFWDACLDHLHGDDLDRTQARLVDVIAACNTAFDRHGATQDTVADLVFDLLNQAPTDNQLAVDIRGLQLAAWHRELYVKVHHTQLHHHEERPLLPRAQVDDTMLAYRQPFRPLTTALTRAGHGVGDITTIRLADCSPDDHVVRCSGEIIELTPAAGVALRAQLHLRRAAGADPADRLLPHSPKALAKALTDARIDLGIHVHGRRAERSRDHTFRALRQLGITVHELP
ncbi:hypothetical protein [Nocardioides sp. SYSU DS0651]|uniref:hypothetical protein n=1 Tax=Nocardioides sp. SYSU DS0651 TaxID=3415955 RepID=UPI003F4B353B